MKKLILPHSICYISAMVADKMKTTRQASTLIPIKDSQKIEGQWHPSNLCTTGRSHSRMPKPHSQWLVDSFCIHWCTPSNIKMWYCESLQEPSVRGFSFHAVNLNYCGEAGDWGGVRWRRRPSTKVSCAEMFALCQRFEGSRCLQFGNSTGLREAKAVLLTTRGAPSRNADLVQ